MSYRKRGLVNNAIQKYGRVCDLSVAILDISVSNGVSKSTVVDIRTEGTILQY